MTCHSGHRALKETSAYYLLAWRPEDTDQNNQRSRRIEVSVNGRPDLVIRFHHGFGDSPPAGTASQNRRTAKLAADLPAH